MDELKAILTSEDVVSYTEDMEYLARKLEVSDSSTKEQRLLRDVFVGRRWLLDQIETWLARDMREPFIVLYAGRYLRWGGRRARPLRVRLLPDFLAQERPSPAPPHSSRDE